MHYKKYNTMEEYKDIKGFEGFYQISNHGNVRSLNRIIKGREYKGSVLKNLIGYGGYPSIQLRVSIKKTCFYIHRLVAEHFLENKSNNPIVNHIDENKTNNYYLNLEFVTASQNTIHSNRGVGFLTRKFNSNQIKDIRERHKNGETIYSICKELNENGGTISNIVNNKTYKNI